MRMDALEEFIAAADIPNIQHTLQQTPSLIKSKTSFGVSPLMLSCYYKKPLVIQALLNYAGRPDLFEASAIGLLDEVAYLLTTNSNDINNYAGDGFTPLGLACYFGRFEVARYLVLKGANVNQPSNNGFNVFPIHSASAGNYTEIVRMLIDNGADVNVRQQAGITPLHSAAQNGNPEMLIILLEKGADISIRMEGGKLPADLARDKGFNAIAEILG